jgi:hypothetical protein
MSSWLDDSTKAVLEAAAEMTFQTFMRAFTVYIEGAVANVSTNPNYSRFGQHDQNVFNPAVNPQAFVISGTILYAGKQPWSYIEPQSRTAYQQDKLRESFGQVRIKVDGSGYALLSQCKLVNLDGFDFKLTSNARPHSMFGPPTRYTFLLDKVD